MNDPTERKRLKSINIFASSILIGLSVGTYLLYGVDFSKGTLLGCCIVAFNLFFGQRLVRKLLTMKGEGKLWLGTVYLFKLGGSVLVLYWAVTQWKLHPGGIAVGLSAIFITTILTIVFRTQPQAEAENQ